MQKKTNVPITVCDDLYVTDLVICLNCIRGGVKFIPGPHGN